MDVHSSTISLSFLLLPLAILISAPPLSSAAAGAHDDFLRCLSLHGSSTSISRLIYTPANSSYTSILHFPVSDRRFLQPTTPRPLAIVTPTQESHVQHAVVCARRHGLQVRVRSGGHDYEGLSSVAHVPFVVIDLFRHRSIDVDVKARTAWVQTGATNGELYYNIGTRSRTLGFPAGVCPTVGVGGHISGGGWGTLMRRYGLAADNVIDARIVGADGRILERASMGEDLFWAIRGGGGGSFGIVLAWKLNLVPVPSLVTVFTVNVTGEEGVTRVLHRFQYVADRLPQELFIRIAVTTTNSTGGSAPVIQAMFRSLFLGRLRDLLPLMRQRFPELGLKEEECREMRWFETVLYFSEFGNGNTFRDLLNRTHPLRAFNKGKSDYVTHPLPESAFSGMWNMFYQLEAGAPTVFLTPYGGRMSDIPATATPYPHRAGNLYQFQYVVMWGEDGEAAYKRHMEWIRRLYTFMEPYVSRNPRAAYVNYRDLDIGTNNPSGRTSYAQASVWGEKYFNRNFQRMAKVKTRVDPGNFFRNEQSVPVLNS